MVGAIGRFPEAVFLKRPDNSGYGFFFQNEKDFRDSVDSFTLPILRSFAGEPVPGQPEPADHIKTAIATLIGQAFDRSFSAELGAEGISRAVAALVRQYFKDAIPRVLLIERRDNKSSVRPGIEFMRHPGHPLAVVVDGAYHGGDAHFFSSAEDYRRVGESSPDQNCWLPQIVYRLYSQTPSVMLGHPMRDAAAGSNSVACRGMNFGLPAPLVERDIGH
jgi:hypothetical protein